MPRKSAAKSTLDTVLAETQEMVGRLLRENKTLKAQNKRLGAELDRVTHGWEQIKALARQAPRRARKAIRR